MAKPTRSQVLALLPASAIGSGLSFVERVTIASGLLFVTAHGLSLDDTLSLRIVSDSTLGGDTPALPGGLAEGTTYYARPTSDDAFALAPGAWPTAAIAPFSSEPVGRFGIYEDPWSPLDAAIDRAWNSIQDDLTAHGGTCEAAVLTDMAACLTVVIYAPGTAAGDAAMQASYDAQSAVWDRIYAPKIAAWRRGVPVKGATDATPTVSEGSPRYRVLGPAAPSATSWGTCSAEVV